MPDWRPDVASRLGTLRLDPAREAEIIDELSQHLEQRYEELRSEGATDDEAFRTAITELTSASVATPRFNTAVLSAFAAVALALAIVGIYGVLSHAVTRRTREIGIRMAVGAVPSRVLAMIIRQSLMVTGASVVIGLVVAAGATRYLEGMLFEVTPLDPWTFLAVCGMALVVAVLAAYPPAARASRVDPLAALRHD